MNAWLMIVTAGAGIVFVAIAIPLIRRRIPPNALYGLRVPATFADEWVWYEANALFGRDLFLMGLALTSLALAIPILGLGLAGYLAWAIVAAAGAIGMGIVGWSRANRLLRERRNTS